ncbi:MAG: NTP transferase domain-containing protein [Bacteroidales bacterium]|nr:NTP transferase domain-containing protein [Bacteroidales bacterium]
MKCLILAAGYATRLYPLTENFPKPLLEVQGKPILDWIVEDILSVVDGLIVVTNHRFAPHFRDVHERNASGCRGGYQICR